MIENNILGFVYMSHQAGADCAHVQGGGGNTSIKLDKKRMAIKASGGFLKDMTEQAGYSIVDYKAICAYLEMPDTDEDVFTQKIKSFVVETENRPSIETGFHAQLGQCVIHTHSVYANILTCSEEGKEIVGNLFPDALWVDYATPGRDLTLAIRTAIKNHDRKPSAIFLQNHGLVTTQDDIQEVLRYNERMNAIIREHLSLPEVFFSKDMTEPSLDYIKDHVLFPDQVVYTLSDAALLETEAAKETLWAYRIILNTITEKELTPHFLPEAKAQILLGLESEKFRQKVITK